jgi:hypothetical protein
MKRRISTELNGFPFLKHPIYVRYLSSSKNDDRKKMPVSDCRQIKTVGLTECKAFEKLISCE